MKIGIINLMPDIFNYENEVVRLFSGLPEKHDLIWIKLESKEYASHKLEWVEGKYSAYQSIVKDMTLDGLIISGAPLEHLEFEQVSYWQELVWIIEDARIKKIPILGICWAALAIAYLFGVNKKPKAKKISGVYKLSANKEYFKYSDAMFTPFSIGAWFDYRDIEDKLRAGVIKVLFDNEEHSYPIIELTNEGILLTLGHPEYSMDRFKYEAERDREKSKNLFEHPKNINLNNPETYWDEDSRIFMQYWINSVKEMNTLV